MPQMKPMIWTMMMIMSIMLITMMMITNYFSTTKMNPQTFNKMTKTMKWKW
uniref:ATP synthase F0 subunit 8 n=1 Tax=Andrena camellia TaxID=1862692 RepID=A0A1W2SX89_9HYME|nr:ATP synthase F0 subunit 8 [Andrena camellia]